MSSNRLVLQGVDELRVLLADLPPALARECAPIVTRNADAAAAALRVAYEAHRRTGDLAEHVVVTSQGGGRFGASAIVENTSDHALSFEYGTQARHSQLGALRGSMPAAHVFWPIIEKFRAQMIAELVELLQAHGLLVEV